MTVGGELVRTTILNNWLAVISVSAVAALNVRAQAQNLIGALALGGAQDDPEVTLGLKVINGITDSFEHRSGVGLNITLMTLHRE